MILLGAGLGPSWGRRHQVTEHLPAALHAEQDAGLIEELDARLDRAAGQGWRYSEADWVRAHRRRQATRYWLPV
jgi:hypothetical protein